METDRLLCSEARNRDRLCYRISDLDPEETYTIQVAAHTEGGAWSDWSEPLDARTQQQSTYIYYRIFRHTFLNELFENFLLNLTTHRES